MRSTKYEVIGGITAGGLGVELMQRRAEFPRISQDLPDPASDTHDGLADRAPGILSCNLEVSPSGAKLCDQAFVPRGEYAKNSVGTRTHELSQRWRSWTMEPGLIGSGKEWGSPRPVHCGALAPDSSFTTVMCCAV